MLQEFENNIQKLSLFTKKDKLLITVSGGIDSVVLLDLIVKSGYVCSIAHCNFGLRNTESDGDELFVKSLSLKYNIPFHTTKFDTTNTAKTNGISIQMAARDLRYNWFEKIRNEYKYDYVLTGHNQNDNVETFLINITRGTGIAGLTGMEEQHGKIIRPLLFVTREQIQKYCKTNMLAYREDSSNSENKYVRNKIRNKVIPLLKEINSDFGTTISDNIKRFNEIEQIYSTAIENTKQTVFEKSNNGIVVNTSLLKQLSPIDTWIYELFREFNFSFHQVSDIKKIINANTGKYIDSETHRILKNRGKFIVQKIVEHSDVAFFIQENDTETKFPVHLSICKFFKTDDFIINKNQYSATLDREKLIFPLQIRKWKKGDYFFPFGMTQKKKLSDFFIDQKLSQFDKQKIWILTSAGEIVWIIGQRSDNRFRVTTKTKNITTISVIKPEAH